MGGITEHLNLANVILGSVFGILFPALCVGAWRMSVRTRENVTELRHLDTKLVDYHERSFKRFDDIERRVVAVEKLPAKLKAIETEVGGMREIWNLVVQENRDDHGEIKSSIASNRTEMMKTLREMHDDLVREFRKGNGNH